MRLASLALVCLALAACRTSSLGACSSDTDCSAGASCDPGSRVCVASAAPDGSIPGAPEISAVTIGTPAGYTSPDGSAYFDTAGAPLAVSATIAGSSGVNPATVCLVVAGESGPCAHPGTA